MCSGQQQCEKMACMLCHKRWADSGSGVAGCFAFVKDELGGHVKNVQSILHLGRFWLCLLHLKLRGMGGR